MSLLRQGAQPLEAWWEGCNVFFVRFLGFFHVFQHAQVCVSGNVQPPVYDEGWWLCVSWVISMCFFSQHDHVCVSLNVHLLVVYDEGWWRNWQLTGQQQEEGAGRKLSWTRRQSDLENLLGIKSELTKIFKI